VRMEKRYQEKEWLGTKTVASDIEEYKKRRVGLAKIQVLTKNSFNYQRNSASLWIGLSLNYYQFIHQNPSTHFVYRCEARERLR